MRASLRPSSSAAVRHANCGHHPSHYTALWTCARLQSSDQFHRFLHNPTIVQPDGLDGLPRTKGEQQAWLNTEQWDGYSETYLMRWMRYTGTPEHPNPVISNKHHLLNACLKLVYELYGTLAEELQKLHDDPLHPQFHARIQQLRKDREQIADALDACYAEQHPTVKTVYDAFLVRRYYHLGDWIEYVVRKREQIFEKLSPEYVDHVVRAGALSAHFIQRLKMVERALNDNPEMGLLSSSDLEQYSCGELQMLKQKALYFRNMRRLGANQLRSDVHTH